MLISGVFSYFCRLQIYPYPFNMYILHLPSWFPNNMTPFSGNFIEKHIQAISMTTKCVTLRVARFDGNVKEECSETIDYRSQTNQDNNIIVEYRIKNRTHILGKVWLKICEWYYYRKGMKSIEKQFGKPKLIHLHVALPMGMFAVKWSKKWKVPLVLTEHWTIYNPTNVGLISASQKRKLQKIFSTTDGVTPVSHNLLACIKTLFPVNKYAVIYNVVDTDIFAPTAHRSPLTAHRSPFPKKILHVSTLDERAKNFFGILDGIKLLREKREDFILEVVCEFRNLKAEAFVKEHNLEKFVHFLGSMPENQVAMQMKACDFLLLFSNFENLPCVILEAMSCGKPVITTPVGGIPEIVNEDRGIFVEPKNINELVEKLDFMLNHCETFDGNLIRNYAVAHASKEVIGQQFQQFYAEIMCMDKI